MNPIMIGLNMLPEVVVATSSITSLFSALVSVTQYLISEESFQWHWGVLILLGAAGSLTSLVILRFSQKYLRVVITMILSLTIAASMVLLTVISIMDYA